MPLGACKSLTTTTTTATVAATAAAAIITIAITTTMTTLTSAEITSPTMATPHTAYPRHVKLPFDLRDRSIKIKGDVLSALINIFPDTINLMEFANRAYLHFTVKQLPKGPLPLTVGGLPFTINDEGNTGNGRTLMFPRSTPGNMSIRVRDDIDARSVSLASASFRNLADSITRAFTALLPDLPVVEFMLNAQRYFYVIVRDSVDIKSMFSRLPGRVAHCWTVYLHDKDLCRSGDQQAYRSFLPDPASGIVDDTPYNVQVRENIPHFTKLIGEAPSDEIDFGQEVFWDNPFTGAMSGIVASKSWKMPTTPPAHPTEQELDYVVYDWIYIGQDATTPSGANIPDSICGSPVWDGKGRITGFLRYQISEGDMKGFCVSVSADKVARAGYKLA